MTDEELNKIRSVVKEEVVASEQRLELRIASSEQRLELRIASSEQRLELRIASSEQQLSGDIGKFMEDHLFPMIEEKADKTDIERLERRFDDFAGKVTKLSTRVGNVETKINSTARN